MTATSGKTGRRGQSVATYVYISVVSLLAVALLLIGWTLTGPPKDRGAVLVLVVLGVLSWLLRESDVGHRVQFSFTSIILLASAGIVGPVGAGIVGAISTASQWDRVPPAVRILNTAMISAVGSLGGLIYVAAGGAGDLVDIQGLALLLNVGFPLMVADVGQCVANAVLLAGVMRVANGVPVRSQIAKLLSTTGFAYIGYGVIGFLLVVLWIPAEVGWFSAILVLAPLFVARWAFVQYGDELRAHERTLDALVSAVEAKDPPSTGHSARVAQLSEWIAESLSMGHTEVDDVRTAGMLHDLGKLALPSQIVRLPRQRSDDEQVRFAEHPQYAVQMLGSIDFLRGSLDGIAHHHERFDGLGYPAGLAGDAIPLVARIIAVADAFDALTTTQPHRAALTPSEALAELERRAGTHVDPDVVAALSRALGRHSWSPTVRSTDVLATVGHSTDHDDPQVSDLLAGRADLRRRIAQAGPALPNLASTGRST